MMAALFPAAQRAARRATALAAGACLALVTANCYADDLTRDPLQPPPAARPAPLAEGGSAAAAVAPRHLMVVDGIRYVVDNGRRRKVGDSLGDARIERIDDSAVYVREAGTLQRLPLYGDVVKRPLAETPDKTASVARPQRPVRPTFEHPSLPRPQRPQRPGDQP
jgi:hypothetical protein